MADDSVPRRAAALIYVDRTLGNFAAKWCIHLNLADERFHRWEKLEYLEER